MIPETLQWTLIAVGVVAIAVLIYVIQRHWRRLSQFRKAQEHTRELQQRRRDSMIESIRILARTIEEEQVEPSEGCIRIKGLLDHVAPDLLSQKPFNVFQTIYEKTEHMPTHDARRQADPKLISRLDEERFALEAEYADHIQEAAVAIRFHRFEEKPPEQGTGTPQTFDPVKSTLNP
ncbi:uncharacterized protein DUF2489 [Halospina denitrificans]|uniref:Uncharacterized protein DUF2489 n=1 Tax=Halospina denitrificans TaxID=332522 RepID=A0A4R7K1Q7_9GAMM|nr:DUF2489 domain-containing protein [Halospina denitrificans]TDT44505.1 uncharacterized protein DUF2489 [Halospina denitrificans]